MNILLNAQKIGFIGMIGIYNNKNTIFMRTIVLFTKYRKNLYNNYTIYCKNKKTQFINSLTKEEYTDVKLKAITA